jgi:hypothetical protein
VENPQEYMNGLDLEDLKPSDYAYSRELKDEQQHVGGEV